jgi:hypothetical protein
VQDDRGVWSNQSVSAATAMCEIERTVSHYGNIGAAGPMTHTFARSFDDRPDHHHHLNRQVCSFLLLRNAQAATFRGGVIEDTDYSLQVLTGRERDDSAPRAGAECTMLFTRLLVEVKGGRRQGGNHDELHYGDEDVLRAKQQRVIDMWPERGFAITEKKGKTKGTSLKSTGQCWKKFEQRPG